MGYKIHHKIIHCTFYMPCNILYLSWKIVMQGVGNYKFMLHHVSQYLFQFIVVEVIIFWNYFEQFLQTFILINE